MKKNEALAVFNSRIVNGQVDCKNLLGKESIEREIRKLSDNDEVLAESIFYVDF